MLHEGLTWRLGQPRLHTLGIQLPAVASVDNALAIFVAEPRDANGVKMVGS